MIIAGGQYRKRPVVIDAFRWIGMDKPEDMNQYPDWFQQAADAGTILVGAFSVAIDTLEGRIHAQRGDWILRGIKGELYPCRDDIFEATYEKVDAG